MISQKVETPDLKSYLLTQIRSLSVLEGVETDNVNQLIMANLEARIQGNEEFYPI